MGGLRRHKIKDVELTEAQIRKANAMGLKISTIKSRYYRGWTLEDALSVPLVNRGGNVGKNGYKGPEIEPPLKTTRKELIGEVGRIKYMQSTDMHTPPCITKLMRLRMKEFGIKESDIQPIPVDMDGIKMTDPESEGEENENK